MKNILLFTPFVNAGDMQSYVESLSAGLAEVAEARGWRIDILGQPRAEGGKVIRYPSDLHFEHIDPQKPLPPHPHLINFLRINAIQFFKHLKRIAPEYDLIFCPNGYWSTAEVWDVATPIITFIPDLGWDVVEMGDFMDGFMSEAACRIAESAAHVVFPSDFYRQLGVERYAFASDKTSTISNCAETYAPKYTEGRRGAERSRINHVLPDSYMLLPDAAGFRGMDAGLIGYALAKAEDKTLPPLVLTGESAILLQKLDTTYGVQMRKLITDELGLEIGKDLLLLEHVVSGDEGGLYAGAEAVLVPSRMDGDVNGAIFKALQAGTTVIRSDLPPFADRLGADDEITLSFPVDDTQALGKQILRARSESPYERERTQRALDWAQAYTKGQWIAQYADLFDRVMLQNGSA